MPWGQTAVPSAHAYALLLLVVACLISTGCATVQAQSGKALNRAEEIDAISRAQVWRPTHVAAMDVRNGPQGDGVFAPGSTVRCRYIDKEQEGGTPKFTCVLGDNDLKVKYGPRNGEVYAEVAATRLLWALGFGADQMYPVRVVCQRCPRRLQPDRWQSTGEAVFEYAAVERKMHGRELAGPKGDGWSWSDLDRADPAQGGAPQAHRDALKLLAVMIQHTDSKREQQRLACLDPRPEDGHECARPFMLINDLGKTFGKANAFNRDGSGSVNLKAWRDTPVWRGSNGCVGNLPKSVTGTLDNPVISEAGRRFLADLLTQLTDRQMRDLFAVARFDVRARNRGEDPESVQDWVAALKDKIGEVANRECTSLASAAERR
jgi:hypothetical protein